MEVTRSGIKFKTTGGHMAIITGVDFFHHHEACLYGVVAQPGSTISWVNYWSKEGKSLTTFMAPHLDLIMGGVKCLVDGRSVKLESPKEIIKLA